MNVGPVIADIQTTELLYYDPEYEAEAYRFCRDRDIDCLPSLDGVTHFYQRDDDKERFIREKIDAERCVDNGRFIFAPQLLSSFRENPLLFVVDEGQLTGVVHFSDYNKPVVGAHLYTQLAEYERNLRRLAELSGLSNKDMDAFFRQKLEEKQAAGEKTDFYQGRVEWFEKKRKKNGFDQVAPFQLFYLTDLIGLLKAEGIVALQGKVTELRNGIMHAHELVEMADVSADDLIYDFRSFKVFYGRVHALIHDALRVENRLRFLSGVDSLFG